MGIEIALLIACDVGDRPKVEAALIDDSGEVGGGGRTVKVRPIREACALALGIQEEDARGDVFGACLVHVEDGKREEVPHDAACSQVCEQHSPRDPEGQRNAAKDAYQGHIGHALR